MSSPLLAQFILAEMQRHGMSAREFARFVGVSHATINRLVDTRSPDAGQPSVEFIGKLAVATQTPLATLIALVLPHVADPTDELLDTETLLMARQFQALSEAERKTVLAMMRGLLAEKAREPREA
jgi:transcriptional regulator with XRE-family HTH domain